jgi:hypothetical protein
MRAPRRRIGWVALLGVCAACGAARAQGGLPTGQLGTPPIVTGPLPGPVVVESFVPPVHGMMMPCSGLDPFCECGVGHPCSGPSNGYANQRGQLVRKFADHFRLRKAPCQYQGIDPWLERMQGGGVSAYGGPSPFGP